MEYLMMAMPYLTGALGGNVIGKILPSLNLGTLGNSLSGVVGGGLGATILGAIGMGVDPSAQSLDVGTLLGQAGAGAAGGGVVMFVVGLIKKVLGKA